VLGFSIGGMVAQEITLQAPNLVRPSSFDASIAAPQHFGRFRSKAEI